MTELEKLEAGLEYCYDDSEIEARNWYPDKTLVLSGFLKRSGRFS